MGTPIYFYMTQSLNELLKKWLNVTQQFQPILFKEDI